MTTLIQVSNQEAHAVTVNRNFEAVSAAALFGVKRSLTVNLTFAYYGGVIGAPGSYTTVADGTIALSDNTTNYIEATTAGAVSSNTAGFTIGRVPLYTALTASGQITVLTDYRQPYQAFDTGPDTFTNIAINTGTITANTPAITTTQTWNNVGVDFVAQDHQVIDTASGAGSLLARWRAGAAGTTLMASISKVGAMVLAAGLTMGGALAGATTGAFSGALTAASLNTSSGAISGGAISGTTGIFSSYLYTNGINAFHNATGNVALRVGVGVTNSLAAGEGVEFNTTAGSHTSIAAYDRAASAYRELRLGGLTTTLQASGSTIAAASSTGLAVTGALTTTLAAAGNVATFTSGAATPYSIYVYSGTNLSGISRNPSLSQEALIFNGTTATLWGPGQTANIAISAVGAVVLGDYLKLDKNQNAATYMQISNTNAGTGTYMGYNLSNGTTSAWFQLQGSGASAYGALLANMATIYTAHVAGMVLMADSGGPIIFAAGGNAEKGRFTSAGLSVTGTLNTTGNAAIGGSPVSQYGLRVIGTQSGSATQRGVDMQPTFNSSATSVGAGLHVEWATAAAAFTMTNGYGMFIQTPSKGAGSAITNNYGLYIDAMTSGSTINRAIHTAGGDHYFGGAVATTGNISITGAGDMGLIVTASNGAAKSMVRYENSADADHAWWTGRESDGTFRFYHSTGATFAAGTLTTAILISTSDVVTFASNLNAVGNLIVGSALTGASNYIVIDGATTGSPYVQWNQNGVGKAFIQYDNSNTAMVCYTAGDWRWRSGSSSPDQMRLTPAGLFKTSSNGTYIDTARPSHEIRQTNTAYEMIIMSHTGANPYGIDMRFTAGSPDNNTNFFGYYQDSTTLRAAHYSDGDWYNHDGTYGTISDMRYKPWMEPAKSQWADVKALSGAMINYTTKWNPYKKLLGWGAQDVQGISPGAVREVKWGGEMALATDDMTILKKGFAALGECMIRVENIEDEVTSMKNQIEELVAFKAHAIDKFPVLSQARH